MQPAGDMDTPAADHCKIEKSSLFIVTKSKGTW